MTREPVAWMYTLVADNSEVRLSPCRIAASNIHDWTETPLYAHPPVTLPDAEIVEMLARVMAPAFLRAYFKDADEKERAHHTAVIEAIICGTAIPTLRNAGLIGDAR